MNLAQAKADLHLHTTYSDGSNSVKEVLRHAAEHTDLRVVAITDHDTIEGALLARRLGSSFGLEVIVGEEISTREGHLLALFLERHVPPHQSVAATIAAVHAQGGLCVAAHPYGMLVPAIGRVGMRRRMINLAEWQLDGIETFNASLWSPYSNYVAGAAAAELGLPGIGGSDSHHLATIGAGYTLFEGRTADDLRAALVAGRVKAGGCFWGWSEVATATVPFIRRELRGLARRAQPTS